MGTSTGHCQLEQSEGDFRRFASAIHQVACGETRRRVKVIGRLPGEHCCLKLVWAVLDRASTGWRGFTMTPAGLRLLADLRRSLHDPPTQLPQRNPDVHTETGVGPTDSVAIA